MKTFLIKNTCASLLIPLALSCFPLVASAQGTFGGNGGQPVNLDYQALDAMMASPSPSPAPVVTVSPSPAASATPGATPDPTSAAGTPPNLVKPVNNPDLVKPISPANGVFYLQNPLSSKFNTVGGIVGGFIQIFVYLVVLLAVIMIIYVGLRLVLAQGDAAEIKKRHEQLLWLVVGLAFVIGARIIVQVVISTLQSTGTVNSTVIQNANNALQGQ